MSKINVWKRIFPARTHEGAVAQKVDPKRELRRSVLTCLLWEDAFYEKGNDIAKRIAELVVKNKPEDVAALAREARDIGRPLGSRDFRGRFFESVESDALTLRSVSPRRRN